MDAERWRLVNRIFQEAAELHADSRKTFLDQACSEDPALRAEVDSLLTAETEAMPPDASFRHIPLTGGQRFGPYRIVGKLGEGGMGVVYQAVDTRLDRRVALKLLLGDDSAASHKTRFAREARAASALNHPNIATIYEFDNLQGTDFIAMEYVEGSSLLDILAQKSTPLERLLDYARQVALAAGAAHAAGIVHRDLKPGNIMIDRHGIVKVLDFGLAKLTSPAISDSDATQTLALTRAGGIIGTPSYMSPEQVAGEQVDHRTDIFAFGIILYEMVCGERPFRGPNSLSTLHQIATAEPKSPAEFNVAAPPRLIALIDRCLKKKKVERLQSMGEAAAELSAVIESRGTPPPVRKSRLLPLAIAVAVAVMSSVVVAGGAYWYSHSIPASPQPLVPVTAERSVICYLQAQRKINGQPAGDPYLVLPRDTFETGSRFRLLVEPQQPGFLYLISDGPDEHNINRLYILYPEAGKTDTPLPPHRRTETPWYGFESNPGTQRLWFVWAEQRLTGLEPQGDGSVSDPSRESKIREVLAKFAARTQGSSGGVELRGADKILGTLVELRHQPR